MNNQASTSRRALETRAPLVSTEAERLWAQHLIFLSHSGRQKPFVAKLDHALRNAGHNPFFDTHSLPLGEPFPPYLCESARRCKLGVVVLSHAFLTSYWPMVELNIMNTSPFGCRILPLFFDIQPSDVNRSSPCFSEWLEAWRKTARLHPGRVNIDEWVDATSKLNIANGIVYDPNLGEDNFIQRVILCICSIVRPPLRYDVSLLIGHKRLTQEIVSLFGYLTSTCVRAPAIGFYAIDGQGKTTICKLMVNHFAYDCGGRCTLIEFPSHDCNEQQIVELCKRALRQLTSMAKDKIDMIHSFDECVQHMNDRLANHNVFIALDNVWEQSMQYAQRILDVRFNKGSKILLTSQSGEILSTLLSTDCVIQQLPSLNRVEARQLFLKFFIRNQVGQRTQIELNDLDVDNLTHIYQFESGYHPAAIIALGVSLGRAGRTSWPLVQIQESPIFKDSNEKVNEVIRRNFDSLPKMKRDLFLDVALIYIPYVKGSFTFSPSCAFFEERGEQQVYFEELLLTLWLNFLHGDKINSAEIKNNLRQLQYAGLLEFDHGFTNVSVHGLYKNLVTHEAFASGRFVLPTEDLSMVRSIKWALVDRVVWSEMKSLQRGFNRFLHNWSSKPVPSGVRLRKLRLLWVNQERINPGADNFKCNLEYMPGLRVLDVNNGLIGYGISWAWLKRLMGNGYPSNISWVKLISVSHLRKNIADLSHKLCVLDLSRMTIHGSLCLSGLENLQLFLLTIAWVDDISGLESLISLKYMSLSHVEALQKVGSFSRRCAQLQVLEIKGCPELREIEGLGAVPHLRQLKVIKCPSLELTEALPESLHTLIVECRMRQQPDLSHLMKLEHVLLRFEGVQVGAVRIEELPCLTTVVLQGRVAEISSIRQLPRLKHLKFTNCSVIRELNWSSLSNLPSLKKLEISECHDLERVVGDPHFTIRGLQYLRIYRCSSLEANVDISRFTKLGTEPHAHFRRRPRHRPQYRN